MRKLSKLFLFLALLFLFAENVYAESTHIRLLYDAVKLRPEPSTNNINDYIRFVNTGETFKLVSANKVSGPGCSNGWYNVYYSADTSVTGYICSNYAQEYTVSSGGGQPKTECEAELNTLGFPEIYWDGLCALRAKYPKWVFIPEFTGIDFSTAVAKESADKTSFIQSTSSKTQGYLSTDNNSYDFLADKFVIKEGKNWYNANSQIIAYYLDPRNSFDEESMFMFEQLSFDPTYQTEEVVKSVLNGTNILEHSASVQSAGETYKVNPIYLASRIRLETTGNYNNVSLSGYLYNGRIIYNPYNIGANTGAIQGLEWAGQEGTYGRPWTSLPIAIMGGAELISKTYTSIGQDTTYFQKFNVSSYAHHPSFTHQYQTNIQAPALESHKTYEAYRKMELLETTSFGFKIPVYDNMPESPSPAPNEGNPNNHLKDLKVDGETVTEFRHDKYEYTHLVSKDSTVVTIEGAIINSKTEIKYNSESLNDKKVNINLTGEETIVTLEVVAENKSVQNYTIKLIKSDDIKINVETIVNKISSSRNDNLLIYGAGITLEDFLSQARNVASTVQVTAAGKQNGALVTGDSLTITNGADIKNYTIAIKGDPTGDGNINIQDLLRVQKYILGYIDLNGSYLKAADTNNDGIIDVVDLLRIQKHILGYTTIN